MRAGLSFGAVFLLFLLSSACESSTETPVQTVAVASPSGSLRIAVSSDANGRLSYEVRRDERTVIESSPLGLVATTHDLSSGVTMFDSSGRSVEDAYTMLTGKRSERAVVGNEITIPLRDARGARAELLLRAQDDGVAYRYRVLGAGVSEVMSESSGFAIPSGARLLTRAYDSADAAFVATAGEYQQPPIVVPLGEPSEATGFAFPTIFELPGADDYVMLTEADLDRDYCGTRLHEMPEGGLYRVRFPDEREGRGVGEVLPKAELPFETPWRVIAVGELSTIVESTIVDDLSADSLLGDTSWIEPGRAAWSWFSQETGTPELQYEYVDFAGEHSWDYVLIDANWDQWPNAADEVRALVAQAEAVGVRLLLWYNSGGPHTVLPSETPIDRMHTADVRRREMQKLSDWGIAGIKVDFFNSDKQDRINQYIGILEDAADYGLLVTFHGCTIPRGWQRTYPNLMTHEAVNGAEVYKFASAQDVPTALTNVRHTLLRNIVGSMDYTPVVFEAALEKAGIPYAHSLAQSALFESGIQHFADRADSNTETGYRAVFGDYPYVAELLSTVPVTWDDTLLLRGDIDEHVILARRKGADWYLAGIHALEAAAEYSFELDFLTDGTEYEMTRIGQGETPDSFEREIAAVDAGAPLSIALPPRGGFIAILRPR